MLQAWQSIYCSVAVPGLRWLFSFIFVFAYLLLVVMSAVGVCWMIFVLPLPPLLTVIASIEQVHCHGNGLIPACVSILLPFSCALV